VEKYFFCPFLGPFPNGIRIHHVVTSIHVPQYLLWPCTAGSLIAFPCSLQKLPYAVGQCMLSVFFHLICLSTVWLSSCPSP